jgi:hypothetical protein
MKTMQYMALEMSTFGVPLNNLPFVISLLDITHQALPEIIIEK